MVCTVLFIVVFNQLFFYILSSTPRRTRGAAVALPVSPPTPLFVPSAPPSPRVCKRCVHAARPLRLSPGGQTLILCLFFSFRGFSVNVSRAPSRGRRVRPNWTGTPASGCPRSGPRTPTGNVLVLFPSAPGQSRLTPAV